MNVQTSFKIGDKILRTLDDNPIENLGESGVANSFSVVGASTRGRLHHHNDTPRDDAFVVHFDGLWLAAAVADGAGSRKLSRHGASLLAKKLCIRLLNATNSSLIPGHFTDDDTENNESSDAQLPSSAEIINPIQQLGKQFVVNIQGEKREQPYLEYIMMNAFRQSRGDLQRFAKRKNAHLEDFHSTLLGLLLNTRTMEMSIGQIGDGLILAMDDNGKAIRLVEPPSSDDPAASYFITQEDWEQYKDIKVMKSDEVNRFSTLYLMTDGVANDCQYGPPPNILEIWAKDMDREIRSASLDITTERLKSYLANYKAKGSFDDRTLVVIFKKREDKIT